MKFLKKKKKVDEEAVSKDEAALLQQQILTLQSDVQRLYKVWSGLVCGWCSVAAQMRISCFLRSTCLYGALSAWGTA